LRDGTSGCPSSEDAKREEALDVSSASWAAAAGREKYDESSYPRPCSTGVEEERIFVVMTGPCSANDKLETSAMSCSSSSSRRILLLLLLSSSFAA
jgi:hypothetical protein